MADCANYDLPAFLRVASNEESKASSQYGGGNNYGKNVFFFKKKGVGVQQYSVPEKAIKESYNWAEGKWLLHTFF